MKKLPQFVTFSECRRLIYSCWQNKSLRPGQAVSNRFILDKKLEDQIYKETDVEKVVQKVWNFTNNSSYQNN
jgi:hypothetical protein